jgi:hypothetical protein
MDQFLYLFGRDLFSVPGLFPPRFWGRDWFWGRLGVLRLVFGVEDIFEKGHSDLARGRLLSLPAAEVSDANARMRTW